MQISNPKILILSSLPISSGPGKLADDLCMALRMQSIDVDILLQYKDEKHPDYLYIYESNKKRSVFSKIIQNLFIKTGCALKGVGSNFFYHTEYLPTIPTRDVLQAINKNYDMVVVLFWQWAFSFKTMKAIYDKLNCLMFFSCVDYSTLSGGCHFTGDCEKYKTGCGNCPAYKYHLFDFTSSNIRYREKFRDSVKPIISCNMYMYDNFYSKSYLWHDYDRTCITKAPIIDTDAFKPLDISSCRLKLGLPDSIKFFIMIGCQSLTDPRKGISYLIEALNIFYKRLTDSEQSEIGLIAIGNDFEKIRKYIPFKSFNFGFCSMTELPTLYNAASCFACSSVNDAGPMMVNQALCCGTPVVGFDMGAIKSVVKNQGTGYCATLKDSRDLANGLDFLYRMKEEDRDAMRCHCADFASSLSSLDAKAISVLDIYKKYKERL